METIPALNKRLKDYFGLFEDGRPRFRVVWSNEQREKRRTGTTEEGLKLLHPEVRELPKYPYLKDLYILEYLVPSVGEELIEKTTYEPLWVFVKDDGTPVPPKFEPIKVLIETMQEAMNRPKGQVLYKEAEIDKQTPEAIEERIRILQQELFGNETSIGDALGTDNAVGYGVRNRQDSKNVRIH